MCSSASVKRRLKGNPVPEDITGPYSYWEIQTLGPGTLGSRNLKWDRKLWSWVLQDLTWDRQRIVQVNYRPTLLPARESHTKTDRPTDVARNITSTWTWLGEQSRILAGGWKENTGKVFTKPNIENNHNRKAPWSEYASELYRPNDRRLSAKLVPTIADRACCVGSTRDPSVF
jgi:hypothetical protein